MNDDAKAALESLRREMADGDPDWWERERLILAHIDGEPARIAAAVADASSAALRAMSRAVKAEARVAELERTLKERDEQSLFEGQREHEWNASFNATVIERAEKAEAERDEAQRGEQEAWRQTDQMRAERDALRAQVEKLEFQLAQALDPIVRAKMKEPPPPMLINDPSGVLAATVQERDLLRAQVEAARKVCELRIKTQWRVPDVYITAHDVLRAMDGAKP